MTTEFRKNHGWNASHIGWFWGGMTVQGILPYFYNRITAANRSLIVDRCYYNTMADTKECSTQELSVLKSAHFTVCQKPWNCFRWQMDNRLCRLLHLRWFELQQEAELFYGIVDSKKQLVTACKGGAPKDYRQMELMKADLNRKGPYGHLLQNVIPDDSADRFDPLEESMYVGNKYD
jgi:hypothetical protein